jgi:hypothetical protein
VFKAMTEQVAPFAAAEWGGEQLTVQLRFAASRG